MTLLFIRAFFLILCSGVGYQIGVINHQSIFGLITGVVSGAFIIALELGIRSVSVRGLSSVVFGLVLGIIMAKLISDILSVIPMDPVYISLTRVVLTLFFSYLGAVFALRGKDEFNVIIPYVRFRRTDLKEGVVIVDTSAIIDGRIADIYKSRFLAGRLVVPRFVLHELQRLADSDDDIKRQRGRRGMELLRSMQKDSKVDVQVHDTDFPDEEGVDLKLIKLAKMLEGRVITTDFNLSRMATIQGVPMLNVNDLVNSVRPVLHTGDDMEILLVKEGKENNQAIGYLGDGTMVVISDSKQYIGKMVKCTITSILQTNAGRMIFGRYEGVVENQS